MVITSVTFLVWSLANDVMRVSDVEGNFDATPMTPDKLARLAPYTECQSPMCLEMMGNALSVFGMEYVPAEWTGEVFPEHSGVVRVRAYRNGCA